MVSIILSIYNAEKYLNQCIESILKQTYTNFELICIDDGSTDSSYRILKEYKNRDSRILIKRKKNSGLTKSLNLGLKMSKGEYIARIDADDLWLSTKLEEQIKYLKENKNCMLLGCNYENIDILENKIGSDKIKIVTSDEDIKKRILYLNPFIHSGVIFHRYIYEKLDGYNEKYYYAQDYEFWARVVSKNYKVGNLNKVLVKRRYSENMISIKKEKKQRFYALLIKLRLLKFFNLDPIRYFTIFKDVLIIIFPRFVLKRLRK